MKKDFNVRRAEFHDAKGIYEVLLAAFEQFRHYYTPEAFNNTVMSEEVAKERIKKMMIYVAIDQEGKVIGTIGWQKVSDKEGHIRGMAVHPKRQGKDSPATALLQGVETDARSQGCTFLSLDTSEPLKRAQQFYKKHGFQETGKISDFFGISVHEYAKKIEKMGKNKNL